QSPSSHHWPRPDSSSPEDGTHYHWLVDSILSVTIPPEKRDPAYSSGSF
ncbi:hypothetical protein AVEN_32096-1, partial [Araneus ventricosus]